MKQKLKFLLAVVLAVVSAGAAPGVIEGITEPINDVTMSSPVSGIVGQRFFEEGAFVKKGQVIVEMEKTLEDLDMQRKKLIRDLASSELERLKSLSARKALSVSVEELGKKEADFNAAVLDFSISAELLRRRQIAAPFDGYVAQLFVKPGEACENQQPLVRLVDPRECYFVSNVEANVGRDLKVGQKVTLDIDAADKPVPVAGEIAFVSPVVDAASGLLRIKVKFANPDGKLKPGVAAAMRLGGTNAK